MSSIKLESNASGTGVFTIASPNSNTNRTLSIPDATGTINTSGAVNEVPAGSASAPSIYPTGDTNTGIFFPAADTIAFAEGGVEAMRIDSSGRVGIGTSAPVSGSRLAVVGGSTQISGGTSAQAGFRFQVSSGVATITGINNDNNAFNPIAFYTGASEAARIDSSGNVGIGTSSPTSPLNVVSASSSLAIAINGRSSDDLGAMYFYANNGSTQHATITASASEFRLSSVPAAAVQTFYTNGSERMRIASAGELLVNTTTVQTGAKLAVTGGIQGIITSGTAVVNPTSPASASIDFTGIPSWVKRITVIFSGLSLTSTADILVQLGDSGGIETTGYVSSGSATGTGAAISTSTAGMIIRSAAAASVTSGIMTIQNLTGNSWVASYSGKQSSTSCSYGGGDKTLSATLTQIRITTTSTDTFDAGTVNIFYEG